MAKGKGKAESKVVKRHRPDAEWLTYDICKHYKAMADNIRNHSICDTEFAKLCKELVNRCDITETQSINILNGLHINDYVAIYERMKGAPEISQKEVEERREYLEWLAQKEERERQLDDYSLMDSD